MIWITDSGTALKLYSFPYFHYLHQQHKSTTQLSADSQELETDVQEGLSCNAMAPRKTRLLDEVS